MAKNKFKKYTSNIKYMSNIVSNIFVLEFFNTQTKEGLSDFIYELNFTNSIC